MWIDFERQHGVLMGLLFGRQAWLYGSDGAGAAVEESVFLPHSRVRRLAALSSEQ